MALTFGTVVVRLLAAVTDGPDVGNEPDLVPLAGEVVFDLNVDKVIDGSGPVVIAKTQLRGVLDDEGYLCTPTEDGHGPRGLVVLSTDNATLNPVGLQYRVTYAVKTPAGVTVPLSSHSIAVPAGSTVDLALVMPPSSAPPVGVAAAEAAAAVAAGAALAAQAAAEGASGVDPSVIATAVEAYLVENPVESAPGAPGTNATITGASATGLAAGAAPTVTLGGTPSARTFAFGLPAGAKGDKGDAATPVTVQGVWGYVPTVVVANGGIIPAPFPPLGLVIEAAP